MSTYSTEFMDYEFEDLTLEVYHEPADPSVGIMHEVFIIETVMYEEYDVTSHFTDEQCEALAVEYAASLDEQRTQVDIENHIMRSEL